MDDEEDGEGTAVVLPGRAAHGGQGPEGARRKSRAEESAEMGASWGFRRAGWGKRTPEDSYGLWSRPGLPDGRHGRCLQRDGDQARRDDAGGEGQLEAVGYLSLGSTSAVGSRQERMRPALENAGFGGSPYHGIGQENILWRKGPGSVGGGLLGH